VLPAVVPEDISMFVLLSRLSKSSLIDTASRRHAVESWCWVGETADASRVDQLARDAR
jgi:hypothetical protein